MVFDLLFRVGPAIKVIFELGYEPKEEFFFELTEEQYRQLEKKGEDVSKTWYTLIPDEKNDVPEHLIADEYEKESLIDGVKCINDICRKSETKKQFSSFEEKLEYLATILPPVFSESSKYAEKQKASHLKILEK